jgi:hypothetical protein
VNLILGEKKMKSKLNIIVTILAILVFCNSLMAQNSNAIPTLDPDLKIINEATLTVRGKLFPKIIPPKGAKIATQNCCTIGDTRTVNPAIDVKEYREADKKGKVLYNNTIPYSAPATCWVISSYELSDRSMSGSSRTISAVPSGYSFIASNQYQQTYTNLVDFATNLNILDKYKADIILKLKEFTDNYSAYSQSLSVSHQSVLLSVTIQGKGKLNGRSWYDGVVSAKETCCPPEIRDAVTLESSLKQWVTETVNKLPNKGKGFTYSPSVKTEILIQKETMIKKNP